ncbi:MAG: hypothetical protein NVSMB44_43490 [Ktedonobacteraceae bacterium]
MDTYEQPTEPWRPETAVRGQVPQQHSVAGPVVGEGTQQRKGLSRRALFVGLLGAGAAAVAGGVALEQWQLHGGSGYQGASAPAAQIGHLLRRAGFGARPDDIAAYAALGYNGAVDRLVNYQQVSDADMENRLKALNLDLTKVQDQQRSWLLRMAWTQRPLLEKMTLFWHGVLTSSYHKVGAKQIMLMNVQNNFLRSHAFDTYDHILLGITGDPAMLYYLDLTRSTKKAPNENYARELMELFTLGLGHYTQQDVYEAAAALTGWHVRGRGQAGQTGQVPVAMYNPRDHSGREITFLGQTGTFDYKDIVRILANHPATPWFICNKLFTFFAYENPSNDDLKPLVDTYVKSNHNIGEVMKTLLLSPQFNSPKAYRARVKSPTEFVVGAYRALDIKSEGKELPYQTIIMGQTLLDPPNVAGWPGDKVSALWLNSGTWMTRLNYINLLLNGGRSKTSAYQSIDLQNVVNTNHIDTPEQFVDYFASYLLDGTLDADRKAQLVDYFKAQGTKPGKEKITLTNGQSYALSKVRGTVYLMMALPEYQLN